MLAVQLRTFVSCVLLLGTRSAGNVCEVGEHACVSRVRTTRGSSSSSGTVLLQSGWQKAAPSTIACPAYKQPDLADIRERAEHGPVFSNSPALPKPSGHVYLFVISQAYVGSTALLSLISTSPHVGNLCGSDLWACEGHEMLTQAGLIPSNDWPDLSNPDFPKDWNLAINVYDSVWNMSKPVLVDKSPSHLRKVRRIAEDLHKVGKKAKFVLLTRSPCDKKMEHALQGAQDLIDASNSVPRNQLLRVNYDDLVQDPYGVSQRIVDFVPELHSLDPAGYGLDQHVDGRSHSIVDYVLEHSGNTGSLGFEFEAVEAGWANYMETFGYY